MSIHKPKLTFITAAHIITDFYPGFIPVMLPSLIERSGYSVSAVGALVMTMAFAANFPQPFFGHLYDRTRTYFCFLAPLLSAIFVSTLCLVENYYFMLLFIVLGGFGVALFHPEAIHIARSTSKQSKAYVLSIFLAGGTGGYALGAFCGGIIIHFFGIEGLVWTIFPGIIASWLLYRNRGMLTDALEEEANPAIEPESEPINRYPAFLRVFLMLTIIISVHGLFSAYLPLLLEERNLSVMFAGASMLFYIVPGSIGGIIAGNLSKKIAPQSIVVFSLIATLLCLWGLLHLPSPWFLAFIPLAGIASLFSFPLLVNAAYECLPKRGGLVGGSMVGLTWGLAGVSVILCGILTDILGKVSESLGWLMLFLFIPLLMTFRRKG